jgi:hypothetical protein
MLVSQFEVIRMEEEETFDEFYSKLSTIRNSTINLGNKMTDAKIIKKILRSLPARFIPQIIVIQQSKDLEIMRVEELVGSLQTFELLLPKPKNSKNLFFFFFEKSIEYIKVQRGHNSWYTGSIQGGLGGRGKEKRGKSER